VPIRLCAVVALIVALSAPALLAQQSRAEAHAEAQAEKAAELREYQPSRAERIFNRLQAAGLFEPPVGLFPVIGSIYPDGGLAGGAGVRQPVGETGEFTVRGAWSIRNYKSIDARLALPTFVDRRVQVTAHAGVLDAPEVAFYGIGHGPKRNRTSFLYRPTTLGALGTATPVSWLSFGGGADYVDIRTGEGGGRFPSIEQRFTPASAPGLGLDTAFVVGRAFAEVDWRPSPSYATEGGFYRVQYAAYAPRDDEPFEFRRLDAEVTQLFPMVRASRVIALRALFSTTDTRGGNAVPYYLLPSLGGGSVLRGFPSFRFRDRHRMLLTAEYRWTPSLFLDMALFYEAGKVTARRAELDFKNLRSSYGIGARFHAPDLTLLRIELGRSTEGLRLIFAAGPVF